MNVRTGGFLALGVAVAVLAGMAWWWSHRQIVPEGFAFGNGRVEADGIDIATKLPGRIAEVRVDEGDAVEANQILAVMDQETLRAQVEAARARAEEARQARAHAAALVDQRETECTFARKEYERFSTLFEKNVTPERQVDLERTRWKSAQATCTAAEAQLKNTEAAIHAADADVKRIQADLDDSGLRAPRSGRVLYRLAEAGEVLPAGGKILTIVDLSDLHMTVFLPEEQAAQVQVGGDARVLLDGFPSRNWPARVSFVAPKAQFTPKEVETANEREKLVFKVKVHLSDPEDATLKPGMRGVAYIRLDPGVSWPAFLQ